MLRHSPPGRAAYAAELALPASQPVRVCVPAAAIPPARRVGEVSFTAREGAGGTHLAAVRSRLRMRITAHAGPALRGHPRASWPAPAAGMQSRPPPSPPSQAARRARCVWSWAWVGRAELPPWHEAHTVPGCQIQYVKAEEAPSPRPPVSSPARRHSPARCSSPTAPRGSSLRVSIGTGREPSARCGTRHEEPPANENPETRSTRA